jgi:tetratricopeptide (TPR) repeat protein
LLRVALIVASLATLSSSARGAAAEQESRPVVDAASWFQRGASAYEAGRYVEAVSAFERAYALRPHAAACFNRARALERLGDTPRAAEAYALALSRAELRAEDQAEAEQRLAVLAQTLGTLNVSGPAGARASIGHVKTAELPIKTYLSTGTYQLELVRKDGQRATVTVSIAAGQATELEIASTGTPWPAPAKDAGRDRERHEAGLRVPALAWVSLGGAALATGLGTYWGLTGLSARDEFERSERVDVGAHDRAVELRTRANVAFGAAALSAVVGVVLVYRASTRPVQVTVNTGSGALGAGELAVGFSGRF